VATTRQAAPGGAATPAEGLTTRRYELPMAVQDPNGGDFFVALPLETQDHAAAVEVAAE
jgi:hypothetical protein